MRREDDVNRTNVQVPQNADFEYPDLVAQMPVVIYVSALDAIATTLYINDQVKVLLGYAAAEFIADPLLFSKRIHPDDIDRVTREIERHNTTLVPFLCEYRIFARDGHLVWVRDQAAIVKNAAGEPIYSQGMLMDVTDLRQAMAALHASNERFTQIADRIQEVFWMYDNRLNQILYVNSAFEKVFGFSAESLYRDSGLFIQALHPDDRHVGLEGLAQQARGKSTEMEYRVVRPDGSVRWLHDRSFPIMDDAGTVLRTTGIAADITARKMAEQELLELNRTLEARVRERTAELEDLYNDAPMGYHALDENGTFIMMNRTELEWLGYTREQVIGVKKFFDIVVPSQRQRFLDAFPQFKQEGAVKDIELDLLRRDGSVLPVLLNAKAVYDAAGRFVSSRTTLVDLTMRQRAEQALRQSQMNLQNFLDTASDLIQSVDMDGNYLYVNNAWCDTLGYTRAQALQMNMMQVIAPEQFEHCGQLLRALAEAGHTEKVEVMFRTAQQGIVIVEGSISSRSETDGRVVTNGIFRDITKRKQAEEAMHLAHAQMESALRTKDSFLANMSHELRTPLNAILGLSESLLEGLRGPLNERQQSSVKNIEASGRHLLELINDILDLSKVDAGRLDLQMDTVAVVELCQASLMLVKSIAAKKKLKMDFHCQDKSLTMRADPKRLKQMLVNLLSNAVKFTPEGGAVDLRVTVDADSEQIHLAVQDTGIGIAAQDIPRLFQPFVQLDSGLHRQYEGTGLGLVLVRRLAELHGGTVTVSSESGVGSCFTISLPFGSSTANARALATRQTARETELPQLGSALIVRDVEMAEEALPQYLRELLIDKVMVTDTANAVAQAAALRPDVIFLEVFLSQEVMWTVLGELKQSASTGEIPVVIVASADERARGLAAGAIDYVVKPVTHASLQDALNLVHAARGRQVETVLSPAASSPKPVRILLAEDNEWNIFAVQENLEQRGYVLDVVHNGREVLDQIAQLNPDLILMDVQMPELDGLETTRILRGMPAYANLPIIAMTALAMPGDRERCLAAGANAYISKPVRLKDLVEQIQELVGGDK